MKRVKSSLITESNISNSNFCFELVDKMSCYYNVSFVHILS